MASIKIFSNATLIIQKIHEPAAQLRSPSASRIILVSAEAVLVRACGCCLDIVRGVNEISLCSLLTYSRCERAASLKPTGL